MQQRIRHSMDSPPPPSYEDILSPCPNPYIASREQAHFNMAAGEMLCYPFDPTSITVQDNGTAGQTATSEMPEGWLARDVSRVDWDVFVGQVSSVKATAGGVEMLVGEWNAWFFAPRRCLVVLDGRSSSEGLNEDEVVTTTTTCGGKELYSFVMTDGRCGVCIGGVFVGFIGEKNEVGFKIGGLTVGITTVERGDRLGMNEEERLVGVEMEAV